MQPGSRTCEPQALAALPWRRTGPEPDLSFDEQWRPYATHGLHPFPAKLAPPLTRWAIEQFSQPGHWLLDPFAGSGTVLVEARLLGRNAVAAEIDPLARLLARVKATPVDPARLEAACERLQRVWGAYTAAARRGRARTPALPEFPNRDHWFHPRVQHELALLRDALARIEERAVREFCLVVYSSTIIAKGPSSVANALDIAHSRSHYFARAEPPSVWARFRDRWRRGLRAMRDFHARADPRPITAVLGHDARRLPYAARSVDAVITSPPYVTAIEYPRGHKFALWWIGPLLGVSHRAYEQLRGAYIGTESVPLAARAALRSAPLGLPTLDVVARALDEVDALRAGRARRYFTDMRQALAEMLRTLKPEGHALLVVADSHLRGVPVPTTACLGEIAESLTVDGARFVHRDTLVRPIRERSRQMPIKRGGNGAGMQTEQIIVLQRRAARALVAVPALPSQATDQNGPARSAALLPPPAPADG